MQIKINKCGFKDLNNIWIMILASEIYMGINLG
jgi:hypothetical protein